MIEADFRKLMADDVTLAGLVGTRIYPSAYEQGTADPCIRFQKISGSIGLTFQGSDGFSEALMQIDARGRSATSALEVRDALVALLHAYRGTVGTTDFRLIRLNEGGDRGVQHEKPNDVDYYTAVLEFRVSSRAAA